MPDHLRRNALPSQEGGDLPEGVAALWVWRKLSLSVARAAARLTGVGIFARSVEEAAGFAAPMVGWPECFPGSVAVLGARLQPGQRLRVDGSMLWTSVQWRYLE